MLRSILGKLSVSGIVSALLAQVTATIRHEVDVAKRELARKLKAIATGIGLLIVAAGLIFIVLVLGCVAAVAALSTVWPTWLAALVIAGGFLLVALVLVAVGLTKIRRNLDLRPERLVSAYRAFQLD